MKHTDELLMECARALQESCKESVCVNCKFYLGGNSFPYCQIKGRPEEWPLPEREEN